MRYISLFSGIEAATVAWHKLPGWEAVAFAEIEPFPSAVLAQRWPSVPNLGDMTKVDWASYRGLADLIVGGSPCQAFSVAGLRESLDDARGNLTLEYMRCIHAVKPKWFVWENVPGVLSTKDNAFGCFLAGLAGADAPLESGLKGGKWDNAGLVVGKEYSMAWRVLDAQHFGVPQRRRRVFLVGHLGDWLPAAEVLFEREGLPGNPAPSRASGKGVAAPAPAGSSAGGENGTVYNASGIASYREGVGTLRSSGGDAGPGSENLLAFVTSPDGSAKEADNSPTLDARAKDGPRRNQGGVIVAQPLNDLEGKSHSLCAQNTATGRLDPAQQDFIEHPREVTHTLRGEGFDASEDGTGRGIPLVTQPIPILVVPDSPLCRSCGEFGTIDELASVAPVRCAGCPEAPIAFSSKDHGGDAGEIAPTLRAGGHADSHANAGVPPAVAYVPGGEPICFDTTQITHPDNGSNPQPGDPSPTLAKGGHAPTIAFYPTNRNPADGNYEDVSPAIKVGSGGSCGNPPAVVYDMRGRGEGDLVPTLTGDHASRPSDYSPVLLEPRKDEDGKPMVFETRFARNGRGAPEEVCPPLKAQSGETGKGDAAPVVFSLMPQNSGKDFKAREVDVVQPLMAAGPTHGNQGGDVVCEPDDQPAACVRRLTPRECERLQGFPDDYTLIRWGVRAKAKQIAEDVLRYLLGSGYTQENVQVAASCPDGPRYKALGNSFAVPVVRWIGQRIHQVDQNERVE